LFTFSGQNIFGAKTFQMKKQERLQREGEMLGAMADKCAFAGTQTAATATEYE